MATVPWIWLLVVAFISGAAGVLVGGMCCAAGRADEAAEELFRRGSRGVGRGLK